MLNRRHLRIKVLQALYAYYQADEGSFHKSEKDLLWSMFSMLAGFSKSEQLSKNIGIIQ